MIAFFMRKIFPVVVFDAKSEMIEISGKRIGDVLVYQSGIKNCFLATSIASRDCSAFSESPCPPSPARSAGSSGRFAWLLSIGCFQVDDELELRRSLDRQIGGLGALEDLSMR